VEARRFFTYHDCLITDQNEACRTLVESARQVPMRGSRTIRTEQNRLAFLETLSKSGNVTGTCDGLGLGRASLYDWRADDLDFAAAWDAALVRGVEALEDEAIRRAMSGSDLLLIFLLKANKPDKYREVRQLDITQRMSLDFRNLSADEIRERLTELRARQDASAATALGPLIEGAALVADDDAEPAAE
jgi:hypothetical protein